MAFWKVEAATCLHRGHLTLTSASEVRAELGWGHRPYLRERPSAPPLWLQFLLLGHEDTGFLRGVSCVSAVSDGREVSPFLLGQPILPLF